MQSSSPEREIAVGNLSGINTNRPMAESTTPTRSQHGAMNHRAYLSSIIQENYKASSRKKLENKTEMILGANKNNISTDCIKPGPLAPTD